MITEQEYAALVSVLQRAPMLPAEVLSVQAIMAKLQPKPAEEPPKP